MSDFDPLDALIESDTSTETSTEAEAVQPDQGQGQPSADSTTEPSAVQPEGQGQPDAQTGLYDLSTVPEEYRSHVERIAKDIDRNANSKFQEAADYRKSWEAYEKLGVNEVDPEGLSALLQFANDLSNPETGELDPVAARDAILRFAESLEIDLGIAPDPDDDGEEPDPIEDLRTRVERFEQAQAEAQEKAEIQTLQQQALTAYQAELADVEQQNGKPFSQDEKTQLIGLAKRFQLDHDEPIKAAYQFINSISGRAEKALVDSQPAPPAPAEPAGRASSAVQPVDSFEDALRIHLERNASAT